MFYERKIRYIYEAGTSGPKEEERRPAEAGSEIIRSEFSRSESTREEFTRPELTRPEFTRAERTGSEQMITVKNVGFVKAESKGEVCNISIFVTGYSHRKAYIGDVMIDNGECVGFLGKIALSGGKGNLCLKELKTGNLAGTGIEYSVLSRIEIRLPGTEKLWCEWTEADPLRNQVPGSSVSRADCPHDAALIAAEQSQEPAQERHQEPAQEPEQERHQKPAQEPEQEQPQEPEQEHTQENTSGQRNVTTELFLPQFADKWQHLSQIYPHIRPFDDDREYLSVSPSDFVILSAPCYGVIRNSFLLHGFYNYQHLILARVVQRGITRFYVGVPGNFYEKEKDVAIYFGFESFECREEPVKEGDFGYYCIPVEL